MQHFICICLCRWQNFIGIFVGVVGCRFSILLCRLYRFKCFLYFNRWRLRILNCNVHQCYAEIFLLQTGKDFIFNCRLDFAFPCRYNVVNLIESYRISDIRLAQHLENPYGVCRVIKILHRIRHTVFNIEIYVDKIVVHRNHDRLCGNRITCPYIISDGEPFCGFGDQRFLLDKRPFEF